MNPEKPRIKSGAGSGLPPSREGQPDMQNGLVFLTLGNRTTSCCLNEDEVGNSNTVSVLTDWLSRQGHSNRIIAKVLSELGKAASLGGSKTLYDANREVYGLLRYGVIETPEKYWLRWKEAEAHPVAGDNPLLRELSQVRQGAAAGGSARLRRF